MFSWWIFSRLYSQPFSKFLDFKQFCKFHFLFKHLTNRVFVDIQSFFDSKYFLALWQPNLLLFSGTSTERFHKRLKVNEQCPQYVHSRVDPSWPTTWSTIFELSIPTNCLMCLFEFLSNFVGTGLDFVVILFTSSLGSASK